MKVIECKWKHFSSAHCPHLQPFLETSMHTAQMVTFNPSRIQSLTLSRNPGWNQARFDAALKEYRRFLLLCKQYPEAKIMAPSDVDELWHMHMLDSVNYTDDCQRIFGGYLHHDPCIDEPNATNTQETLNLYETFFGEKPGREWTDMLTCAGPGKGCGSISALSTQAH